MVQSGNVGLGTASPQARLDVNGNMWLRGDLHQPRGWNALGAERYVYSGYWNTEDRNDEIAAPAAGFTTVDIHGPFWTTRDNLWTGTITVIARTGAEAWAIQYFYYGNFWGHTIGGYDWSLSPITGTGLVLERADDWENTMLVRIPGDAQIRQLVININVFARHVLR